MDVMSGALLVGQTKSGKLRCVPLPPDLLKEVRTHVGGLVPFSVNSPGFFANACVGRAGYNGFTSTSYGTRSLAGGSREVAVWLALQELLGHASIVTTQRYARLSDDLVQREVERLALG